jgi:hypothetical protein
LADRLVYILFENNQIDKTEDFVHKCKNKLCVNPNHMIVKKHKYRGNRTHCIHGHLFSDANTKFTKSGWRKCVQCMQKRQKEIRAGWNQYFIEKYGPSPKCQVCNKKLDWYSPDRSKCVHFDHRLEGKELIKTSPRTFTENREISEVRKKIFDDSKFGILCISCNTSLPSENRMMFLKNAIKYVEEIL